MTRSLRLVWPGLIAAAVMAMAGLSDADASTERPLIYPRPAGNCCSPNVQSWGYFPTRWRVWPGDQCRLERINPLAVGREQIPTPLGQEQLPLPKVTTPPTAPSTPIMPPSEPVPEPPAGGLIPQEGLLLPPSKPSAPSENAPSAPAPGGGQPAEQAPGLPGLPDLPPEPESVLPPAQPQPQTEPPARKPSQPKADPPTPAPREKAGTRTVIPLQASSELPRVQPAAQAVAATPPASSVRKSAPSNGTGLVLPDSVVSPMTRLEPERNTVLPGVYRADAVAPPASRTGRVEAVAYAMPPEPPMTRSVERVEEQDRPSAGSRVVEATAPAVALNGYCVVELVRNGRWAQGDVRWTVVYDGRIYRLAGSQQREDFLANPETFVPCNSGNDPVLLMDEHRAVVGQTAYCATYNGRLYMFSCEASQAKFNNDPARYAAGK